MPRGTYKNCHEWPLETKLEALALREVYGEREASLRTGVPIKTIRRWALEEKTAPDPERVRQFLQEREDKILERIDKTLQKVLDEVDYVLSGDMGRDQKAAKWLHAVVGVFSQYFQKRLLLKGMPTNRVELERTVKRQYEITQRIIADERARELAWRIYAEQGGLDQVAPGGVCLRGDEGEMEPGKAPAVPE